MAFVCVAIMNHCFEEDIMHNFTLLQAMRVMSRGRKRVGGYKRAPNVKRDFEGAYQKLKGDYFVGSPKYTEKQFRRRFRMKKCLFMRLLEGIVEADPRFERRSDCVGKGGIYPIVIHQ